MIQSPRRCSPRARFALRDLRVYLFPCSDCSVALLTLSPQPSGNIISYSITGSELAAFGRFVTPSGLAPVVVVVAALAWRWNQWLFPAAVVPAWRVGTGGGGVSGSGWRAQFISPGCDINN